MERTSDARFATRLGPRSPHPTLGCGLLSRAGLLAERADLVLPGGHEVSGSPRGVPLARVTPATSGWPGARVLGLAWARLPHRVGPLCCGGARRVCKESARRQARGSGKVRARRAGGRARVPPGSGTGRPALGCPRALYSPGLGGDGTASPRRVEKFSAQFCKRGWRSTLFIPPFGSCRWPRGDLIWL